LRSGEKTSLFEARRRRREIFAFCDVAYATRRAAGFALPFSPEARQIHAKIALPGDRSFTVPRSKWRANKGGFMRSRLHLRARLETPISFTLMVHHVVLYKLKPEVTPARVEAMMMNTRMQLLKIPEVRSIKCGKRIDPELPWPFFIAMDFESMDKYAIFREDPIFVKFMEEIIKPNTEDSLTLDFEMDPGKDVRFS
jgi:hypothetical protein